MVCKVKKDNIGVFMRIFKGSKRNKKNIVMRERDSASRKIAQMSKERIIIEIFNKKNAIAKHFNNSHNPLKLI